MKWLLTNHHLENFGGTEMWVYTVAKELLKRGDDVTVFCWLRGEFADLLERLGVEVVTDVTDADAVLVNHNTCLHSVRDLQAPKVYTSHGPKHKLEWPIPGADGYVSVSEEVRATFMQIGCESIVIRNPIDLELYQPADNETKRVLCLSKGQKAIETTREACQKLGWEFDYLHRRENPGPSWEAMQRATHVVGVGRGVYEALASGKQVVAMDSRPENEAEGLVTRDNVENLCQRNCSGRFYRRNFSATDLADCLSLNLDMGWARPWAEENVNVSTQVDRYLDILSKIQQRGEAA